MKKLTIDFQGKNITEKELNQFITKNKLNLPDNFIEVLLLYGGSDTLEEVFQQEFYLDSFLPLYSDINPSIEKIYRTYLNEDNQPYWIPFATDPGGWVFVINLSKEKYGQIFIDRFDYGGENPMKFVCNNIEEFIDGLEEEG